MNESDMKKLFSSYKIRKIALELTDAALAKYLISKKGYEACICGGDLEIIGKKYLKDVLDIEIKYVLGDSNADKLPWENICLFCFLTVEDEIINKYRPQVVVDLSQAVRETIKKEFYMYFVQEKEVISKGIETYFDEVSRSTYYEYVRTFLEGDIYKGPLYSEEKKYFDVFEEYYSADMTNMAWINVGSCGGDTMFWALNRELEFGRIYAIEADYDQSNLLRHNISLLDLETQNKIICINAKCGIDSECMSIDGIDIENEICLINMDIEGDEISALESATQVIRQNKPILAICAYHKPDDLISIPNKIIEICPHYKFVLRKYLSGTGRHYNGVHRTNELVLYAIPV